MVPMVMDDTPDVIPIGWLCVELGWTFWWPPYSLHLVRTPPQCKAIVCNVRGHTFTLMSRQKSPSPRRPAPGSQCRRILTHLLDSW